MIKKVNSFTYKSFKNYTNPNGLEFKLKNVIFAYNGRGKSSLSVGLKQEFLKDETKTENDLRFYNKDDYIKNSLLLENESSKLKGVKATFGKKDVDAEKKIKELNSQIVDIKPISREIEDIKINIKKEISTIHNKKKGTAKIQQKEQSKTIDEVLKLYKNDLDDAKKIEVDENKLKEIKGDNKLADKKQQIEVLDIGNIETIPEDEIKNIKDTFLETFYDIDIPSSEIIDWLNQGLRIHQEGDNCKFCGGKLDYRNLSDKVKEYSDNKKQQAVLKLQTFLEQLKKTERDIDSILDKEKIVLSILEQNKELEILYKEILDNKNEIVDVEKITLSKLENINQSTDFDYKKLKNSLKSIVDSFVEIRKIKNKQKQNIENQVSKRDVLIKGSIACEILDDSNIKNWKIEFAEKDEILKKNKERNKEIENEIDKLKNAKSEYGDFMEYLNKILSNLSIDLKLELLDKSYILKHSIDDEPLTIDDISEGEKNLLALLFFYYELFEDNQQQKLKKINLIIVDDPISSLDDTNKMYILEMMKQLLDTEEPQIFIMTHSWEDFCNLCYGKKDKDGTSFKFIEIKKNNSSFLEQAKTTETPYKHHFREIFELSEKSDTSGLTDCEIYHYPNIIRSVLEEFLRFKATRTNPTKTNEETIGKVLFGEEWAKISNTRKVELGALLSVCNILSHKFSRNPDEILRSAKFLMDRIKEVDKNHFDANK